MPHELAEHEDRRLHVERHRVVLERRAVPVAHQVVDEAAVARQVRPSVSVPVQPALLQGLLALGGDPGGEQHVGVGRAGAHELDGHVGTELDFGGGGFTHTGHSRSSLRHSSMFSGQSSVTTAETSLRAMTLISLRSARPEPDEDEDEDPAAIVAGSCSATRTRPRWRRRRGVRRLCAPGGLVDSDEELPTGPVTQGFAESSVRTGKLVAILGAASAPVRFSISTPFSTPWSAAIASPSGSTLPSIAW